MTWILLYILMGILVLVYLLLFAISKIQLPAGGPRDLTDIGTLLGLKASIPFALQILTSFGAVLSVILMASSVGNEYNWRTVRIALISSESRFKFLSAKLISVAIAIFIGMVIGVAVGFLMSTITTAIGGTSFDFSFATGTYLWDQFLQFWRTFFVILPFTLVGFSFCRGGPFGDARYSGWNRTWFSGTDYYRSDATGRRVGGQCTRLFVHRQCQCDQCSESASGRTRQRARVRWRLKYRLAFRYSRFCCSGCLYRGLYSYPLLSFPQTRCHRLTSAACPETS